MDLTKIPLDPMGPELLERFKVLNRAIRFLTDSEFRIVLAVFDNTSLIDVEAAALTLDDLVAESGLSRPTVSVIAQALVEKGILRRTKVRAKTPFVYRIEFERLQALGKLVH